MTTKKKVRAPWVFADNGFPDCMKSRSVLKCLRRQPVPGTPTGIFPEHRARWTGTEWLRSDGSKPPRGGTVHETQSLIGPLRAEIASFKEKCPRKNEEEIPGAAATCPMQLVFPPEIGPALRSCRAPGEVARLFPVRNIDEMVEAEQQLCPRSGADHG